MQSKFHPGAKLYLKRYFEFQTFWNILKLLDVY